MATSLKSGDAGVKVIFGAMTIGKPGMFLKSVRIIDIMTLTVLQA